jgi:hypothetical protein
VDYVYICREGNNEELRYSIRSVVKNTNCRNIWIIGHKPEWYSGNFFMVKDVGSKFSNIINCTKTIPLIDDISDDFIMMNDDFFFLKYIDSPTTYHGGRLKEKANSYSALGANGYTALLRRTYKDLVRQGIKNPIDYEVHLPMPMNKKLLAESVDKAYFPRSAYGNLNKVGGELITDVKTYPENSPLVSRSFNFKDKDARFVSTDDVSFQTVYDEVLRDMFPEPSQYEII